MIKDSIKKQKPLKCTLTRIENEFTSINTHKEYYANIVKNYIYIPEKKIIA